MEKIIIDNNLLEMLHKMYELRDDSGKYLQLRKLYPIKDITKPLLKIETDKLETLGLIEYETDNFSFGKITEEGIKYVEANIL